jgi:FMN phosphatase YigB (HAD superfamily)
VSLQRVRRWHHLPWRSRGWIGYFDGVIVSGVVGVEKPDPRIFEETPRVSGMGRESAIHVGNDPTSDIRGAAEVGIDTVLVDCKSNLEAPEATFTISDLYGLPSLLEV